jgi:hypothetical protein
METACAPKLNAAAIPLPFAIPPDAITGRGFTASTIAGRIVDSEVVLFT